MRIFIISVFVLLVAMDGVSAQTVEVELGQRVEAPCIQSNSESMAKRMDQQSRPLTVAGAAPMSTKEKADVFLELMRFAYDRYDRTVNTLWYLRLAVWSAFGLATWFVLSSEKWRPKKFECVVACLIALSTVVTVVFIWGPYQFERTTLWNRVGHYWESAVEHVVDVRLPDQLQPASLGMGGWMRHQEKEVPDKPRLPWYHSRNYISHSLITALFGLLFIVAIVSRTDWRSTAANQRLFRKDAS